MIRLLVIGAAPGSLGEAVVQAAEASELSVTTAGISGEKHVLDVQGGERNLVDLLGNIDPLNIVCTVGINRGDRHEDLVDRKKTLEHWYLEHFLINAVGPMKVLEAWERSRRGRRLGIGHFAAISSNSAHIARTNSAPYCASKAALSMALRVKARELARAKAGIVAYGYEPGLIAETPMTKSVIARMADNEPVPVMHRMPGVGPAGISKNKLAWMVVNNIRFGTEELNGCMFRIDAGEQ